MNHDRRSEHITHELRLFGDSEFIKISLKDAKIHRDMIAEIGSYVEESRQVSIAVEKDLISRRSDAAAKIFKFVQSKLGLKGRMDKFLK